ncbi:MAG: rhodanese-like domain-containing protein [Legionella longbeachae]|nr:rhodanese-like domain-containing protein [Legionella longbeachae]
MTNPSIKTIDVHELKNRMEKNPELCLIDVRELDEWNEFHITSAIHLPKSTIISCIEAKITNKNQPLYLYCKGGVRSLYAAQFLIDMGYQEIYSIDGGIIDWSSAGYPIKRITSDCYK